MEKQNIIDSHCHIQFPAYDKDRGEVINRAKEANVKMIVLGTQLETSKRAVELAHKYPDSIWATVGFHPNHLLDNWHHDKNEQESLDKEEFDLSELGLLAKDPKVVAIGEVGLDYFYSNDEYVKLRQKEVLAEMIVLAKSLNKPVLTHSRPTRGTENTYEDLIKLVKDLDYSSEIISHFHTGSIKTTKKMLGLGFSFSFGGVVTLTKEFDDLIKIIPLDRLLLETDSPYVSPLSQRGKRNEPSFILETGQKIAKLKNISEEDLYTSTYSNAKRIFRL